MLNKRNHSDGSDFPGYFIRAKDGKLKCPFHHNINLTTFQITIASIAIPLNLILLSAILSKHELRSKPRNIFLISVIFSHFSAFSQSLMEVSEAFLPVESEEGQGAKDQVCKIYMFLCGTPEVLTLVTTLLSLIDRFVAAANPLWHRSKATALWASFGVISTMIIAFVLTKFLYIFQIIPLLCGIHSLERQIVSFNAAILVVFCFTSRIIIFFQTRRFLRNQIIQVPAIPTPTNDPLENNQDNEQDNNEQERVPQTKVQPFLGDGTTPRRNCSLIRHREMESEAIKNLASGVTTLLILFCPILIFVASMSVCRAVSTNQMCYQYAWLSGYLKQLHQLYGLYHPVLYLGWNKEFHFVLKNPLIRMISRLPTCRHRTRIPPTA